MLTLLVPLVTLAATTWIVDVNGGGDFTEISEAVAAAAAGDVVVVAPGTYEGFALTKRLTILGRTGGPRPHISGDVRVQASTFTVAGLEIELMHVTDVASRGRIDDCKIIVGETEYPSALTVLNCAELVVSRTTVLAESSYSYSQPPAAAGGTGMTIQASKVTLVQCTVYGGAGDDETPEGWGPYSGGTGLRVIDGSDVVLVGSTIVGGEGGWPFGFSLGAPGGPAVSVTGSTVRIRGDVTDKLQGGHPGLGSSAYGASIKAIDSTVVSSGLQYTEGFSMTNSLFILPRVAEPFLAVAGNAIAGVTCSIVLHGPSNTTALLAASLQSSLLSLPAFEGELWLDPSALLVLIPVGTTGQDTPVALNVHLPSSLAGLEGVCFELQAFFPTVQGALDPGKKFAGNVAELILRL